MKKDYLYYMKERITFGWILSKFWIAILIAGAGWAAWSEWREKSLFIIPVCIGLFIWVYFSIRTGNEKNKKERLFRRYELVLKDIAHNAHEKKIQSMARKALFDENHHYDIGL